MRVPSGVKAEGTLHLFSENRYVFPISMAVTNPEFKTVSLTRIRVAVVLHLQLWPAKPTRKSSEIKEPYDETIQSYGVASFTMLDAAEGLVLRTYDIRESLAHFTSDHSLCSLRADDDLVGPLIMIQESSVDIDDEP